MALNIDGATSSDRLDPLEDTETYPPRHHRQGQI